MGWKNDVIDQLQWAFDLLYALIPRSRHPQAVVPLLVGHRGVYDHPDLLENTLPAFDLAVDLGGGIEFDLHLTSDNIVVIHHDPTLKRVHGARGAIRDLTLAEIQERAPEVPTLDEVLERYGHRCPGYFMEPKVMDQESMDRLLDSVGRSLHRAGLASRATIISFDPLLLDRTREVVPHLAKAMIFMVSHQAASEYALKHGDTGLAGWYFSFPEPMRAFLEERGLHQGVGQIDYLNTFHHFCNRGYACQFTNRIDRLVHPVETLTISAHEGPFDGLIGVPG